MPISSQKSIIIRSQLNDYNIGPGQQYGVAQNWYHPLGNKQFENFILIDNVKKCMHHVSSLRDCNSCFLLLQVGFGASLQIMVFHCWWLSGQLPLIFHLEMSQKEFQGGSSAQIHGPLVHMRTGQSLRHVFLCTKAIHFAFLLS